MKIELALSIIIIPFMLGVVLGGFIYHARKCHWFRLKS
jgi:uncharacterized protein YneF (UPF0154 family)